MKIAVVIDIFQDKGNGTSMSARRFVENLREKGHEVVVLCQGNGDIVEKDVITFKTKTIPFFQKTCESQHAILANPDDVLIRKSFVDVDIIHIYLPFWLGTHCARIGAEMGIPVLGCYHLSAENITFNAGLRRISLATMATYSFMKKLHYKPEWISDIHCPSRCIAGTILKYGYTQNLHVISNGFDPKFKPIEVERPDDLKGKLVITSVGRLTEEKRQDLIIKAIGRLPHKEDIVLFLAGKGPKESEYIKLAERLKVDMRIVFCSSDELKILLNNSDLFIQASDVETESIACLEAIACGVVPIISNAKMCATKQFALDKTSLFKKGRVGSLKKRICYWYNNPEKRKESRLKYAEFAEKFALEKSIESIEEVYNQMLTRKKRDEYFIKDYNNPLHILFGVGEDGKPEKRFRPLLKTLTKLLCK